MAMLDKLTKLASDDVFVRTDGQYSDEKDWGVANPNRGIGTPVKLRIVVKETFAGGTTPTLTLKVCHGASAGATDVLLTFDTKDFSSAYAQKGDVWEYPWPLEHKRHTRILATVTGGSMSAGKVDADVVAGQ